MKKTKYKQGDILKHKTSNALVILTKKCKCSKHRVQLFEINSIAYDFEPTCLSNVQLQLEFKRVKLQKSGFTQKQKRNLELMEHEFAKDGATIFKDDEAKSIYEIIKRKDVLNEMLKYNVGYFKKGKDWIAFDMQQGELKKFPWIVKLPNRYAAMNFLYRIWRQGK